MDFLNLHTCKVQNDGLAWLVRKSESSFLDCYNNFLISVRSRVHSLVRACISDSLTFTVAVPFNI